MDSVNVDHGAGPEYRTEETGCSQGSRELLHSENRAEVLRIDAGIVAIPLFGIDVPSSSQRIRLRP